MASEPVAKKRKAAKGVGSLDFSEWALQDTARAPLPAVSASDPSPQRWLGVQSLASIATGRDGKVVVCNAAKRDLHFEFGYVEGRRQETHIVMPLDAPRAVANLFSNELAKKVLMAPSFLTKLEEAAGGNLGLSFVIDQVLAELEVCTPEEFDAMKAFCAKCGFIGDEQLPLRVSRVNGELVLALIDAVRLAKKCSYEAAKKICQRLLLDYWHFDMETSGISGGTNLTPQIFHSIRLQGGDNGGGATICVGAACLAEVLILIPGCELSVQLRRDMVQSFFGIGGNEVTFESLLSNPRIQAHLHGSENPVGEFLEDGEHKILVRKLPALLQDELKRRDEHWQQIVVARDEHWQQIVLARDEALLPVLQRHSTEQLAAAQNSFLEALGIKLKSFFQMALAGHINSVVEAAVRSGLALKRAQPKKKTANPAEMPEAQRATPVQTGPLSLGLSTVALELWPELPFAVWRKLRSSFGYYAKQERLRLHGLGPAHAEYVEKPLLWAYTGATVEGGGARYVYLQEHRLLLRRVFTQQRATSKEQRAAGAPSPTESLEQRAHRLAARLRKAEREQPWPVHAAELEPDWDECVVEE